MTIVLQSVAGPHEVEVPHRGRLTNLSAHVHHPPHRLYRHKALAAARRLADTENLPPELRAEIRNLLVPLAEDIRDDARGIIDSASGQDSEYAVDLFVDLFEKIGRRALELQAQLLSAAAQHGVPVK